MRRILYAFLALVFIAVMSSCSELPLPAVPLHDDTGEQSSAMMKRVAETIKDHDAAALKKLFSSRAREKSTDLDSGLAYFLSVFPSGRLTWEPAGTNSVSETEGSKETVELFCNFLVTADGKKYELYFAYFPKNEIDDPRNVGIYALGATPHTKNKLTASGKPKPFYVWKGSFQLRDHVASGDPGIYLPAE